MVTIRGAEPVARHEVDPPDGPALLRRWVAHGLITQQEADAIAASEGWGPGPTAAAHPRRASVAAEALGYLGAVLVVVAASLLSARYWSQIPPAGRLALPAGAAVLLFVSGLAVAPRRGAAAVRVRSVLWLASVVALGFAVWVLGHDLLRWTTPEDVLVLVGLVAAAYAVVLGARTRALPQLVGLFAALTLAAGAGASPLVTNAATPVGLAIWGTGAVWLALAWGGLLPPRRGALVLGALGVVVGSLATVDQDWGYVLAVVSVAALVGLGVLLADVLLLAVAAVGAMIVLPLTINHFFPGALAAPLALLATGLVLIAAALRTVRRHRTQPPGHREGWAGGRRPVAVGLAAALAVATVVAVLLVGRG